MPDIVKKQIELGIDVIDDGEQGKPSFLIYVNERPGGFEPSSERPSPWVGSREVTAFPECYEAMARGGGPSSAQRMICRGSMTWSRRT